MLERTLNPPEPDYYECPVCEREIPYGTLLFYNEMGECVGCEDCITTKYVEDYYEEMDLAIRESLHDA